MTPPSDGEPNQQHDGHRAYTSAGDAGVERPFGKMNISKEEISYVGEHHWKTILSSLDDIQRDLDEDDDGDADAIGEEQAIGSETNTASSLNGGKKGAESPPASTDLHFMLGGTRTMSKKELIAAVPEKRVCDRLLSLWFSSPDPFKILIHAPTFQEEYKQYWQIKDVPTMWLGLLFSLLALAESFGLRNGDADAPATISCAERVETYQSLAASAAVLADYTKPKPYTLECLIIYMAGLHGGNDYMNTWLMMGLIIRLALRMGYHRDPGLYSKISPFHLEMRRRVWSGIYMLDVLISFQLGLPSMVRTVATDTGPPRNLLDRDFSVHSRILPPGRSQNELTPSLYIRAKLAVLHVFSEAAEQSNATIPPTFETTLDLDRSLEKAKEELPLLLQMPDMSELVTEPPEQVMCRINLDLLYLKCKIVLYRKYMLTPLSDLSKDEQTEGIGAARKTCIQCASRVLRHHHAIYAATQPGGQLESVRWYLGSISTHDFLLAAMVLCLELSQQLTEGRMQRISGMMQCPTRKSMMGALEESHKIWSTTSEQKKHGNPNNGSQTHSTLNGEHMVDETEKASRAMAAMLAKIKAQYPPDTDVAADQPDDAAAEELPHPFLIGITREGAQEFANKPQVVPFHGVVSSYEWDGVPEDFQFVSLQSNPTPATSTLPGGFQIRDDQLTGNAKQPPSVSDGLSVNGAILDDPMSLDWQAWDTEVFGVPEQQDMAWSTAVDLGPLAQGADFPKPNSGGPGFGTSNTSFAMGVGDARMDALFGGNDMQDINFDVGPFLNERANSLWPGGNGVWPGVTRTGTAE